MGALTVLTGAVKAAGETRRKPRKMFRGRERTMIRKCKALLHNLRKADQREETRAAEKGYTPALVFGLERTANRNAYDRIISRLAQCLAMQTGDE